MVNMSRMSKKPAVNAPCHCGSGKKFKKCCGSLLRQTADSFHDSSSGVESAKPALTARVRPGVAPWQMNPGLPCPCGSGKPHRACCEPVIGQNKKTLPKKALQRFNAEDYVGAESLYRTLLVQYLQWVHEHTLPFAKAKIPVSEQIIHVDLEALTELAHAISHCIYALGKKNEIPAFLNHVESMVPLPGFEKHAAYLRASWVYIALNDRNAALRELEKLGDILDYSRREAWELYLDVLGADLPERRTITIAQRIVDEADRDEHVRVQYTAVKAIALLQIGEADQARTELDALLGSLKLPSKIETPDEISTEWQVAKAWSLYGNLFRDDAALGKAEASLLRIPDTLLKPAGKAALQRDLGLIVRDQERYCDAAESFKRSLAHADTQIVHIYLIHSLALCGQIDEARSFLGRIAAQAIDPNLSLEYFAAQGSLAIAAGDTPLAAQTAEGLRTVVMKTPFWDAQRNQLIIQMLDFVHRPDATPKPERQRTIIKILLLMNEVFELKPHLFGVGVNINKLFEKLAKRDW